jgi:hypothetical protein
MVSSSSSRHPIVFEILFERTLEATPPHEAPYRPRPTILGSPHTPVTDTALLQHHKSFRVTNSLTTLTKNTHNTMATTPDYSRPTTPDLSNALISPLTPKPTGLALTEYSANPSPPSGRSTTNDCIPDAFLLPNGYPDYLRLILTSRVYEVVEETPLTHATNLSNRLECNVLLKREDLQPVFSFKLRGAYNKMAHLEHRERWRGVVACSAG